MRDLDEKDMVILELLAENARRSYSDLGEAVDLSAPAVSDRVSRLQEAGVIRGFTVDVDRATLRAGVPLLVTVDVAPGRLDAVQEALSSADSVEYVFTTAAGDVVFHARLPQREVRPLLETVADDGAVRDFTVDLLTDVDWSPTVGAAGFDLECVECGNAVGEGGESASIGGTRYHFCCPTCRTRFEERYAELERGAD